MMCCTGHTRASRAGLLAVVACLAMACLATACASTATGSGGTGPSGVVPAAAGDVAASPAALRASRATRSASPPASEQPSAPAASLAGITVGIDPGHNGLNGTDPSFINHLIWNGRASETCDTTGTQTAAGYTEALFNFNVARYLRTALLAAGARVVMTRASNHGVGPCVDRRARILNDAGARVAIDIHADGGPSWGRGFTVLEPVADGPNNKVIGSSIRFGHYVHHEFLAHTPMRVSNYYGRGGYILRNDLAGLNLTTVPKVLIECGNMPNPADASLLTTPRVQRQIARAFEAAINRFLIGRLPPVQPTG